MISKKEKRQGRSLFTLSILLICLFEILRKKNLKKGIDSKTPAKRNIQ
ncbi:MAG: hypothetical protein JETT_2896 [Candidatus Jettenia ecosi]|uniref:Uncharacterized protein n=1 Tax=Candidatus Jettenia ecosi TaxID=2494326 RepID=A0A533Q868_9BACT|nr:MAG: hypothetical protein JETT_2896 [Candidatus Jettenia ecosi]